VHAQSQNSKDWTEKLFKSLGTRKPKGPNRRANINKTIYVWERGSKQES